MVQPILTLPTPQAARATPLISVLIPCYNTARYLPQAVESVRAQTFSDFEIILLNDGSTDHTDSLLREFANRDPRIRTHSRPNKGLIDTRNELLSMARGEFLSWHDSDDTMTHQRLGRQLECFQQDPALAWVGGACTLTDPDGLPIRSHAFPSAHEAICEQMQTEFGCYFGSTLMRRQIVQQLGGFRHPFKVCEDFDLCLRMSEVGRVANIPEVVLHYRQHMASTCNSTRSKVAGYARLARQLAAERASRPDRTDRLARGEPVTLDFSETSTPHAENQADQKAQTHRRWGWWALADGHLKTARKYARHALRESPLTVESWKLMACAIRGH